MLKKTLIAGLVLSACNTVFAQSTQPEPSGAAAVATRVDVEGADFKKKAQEIRDALPVNVTAETVGSAISPEERRRLEDLAAQITDKSMQRFNSEEAKKYQPLAEDLKRRADDIADKALAGNRAKVLKFLGIDPDSNNNLYYFVSFAMPLEMLRAYVLEAMWSGGTVVFRGVPEGKTITTFFTQDLRQLVYGKGAAANISMDPRLFEVYAIDTVPSIVYTEDRGQPRCAGEEKKTFKGADGNEVSYEACARMDPSKYWKISGAVTSLFALQSFTEAGASGARVFEDALRKGMAPGAVATKKQGAFTGDWKDAVSPDEILAGKQAIEAARFKQQADAIPTEPGALIR